MSFKAGRRKIQQLTLHVVFDTNALYTGSESFLMQKEVSDLIRSFRPMPDLAVCWIVPEVVRHERQYQMLRAAMTLLPQIERLQRLLGHNLNITADIIRKRVEETVNGSVSTIRRRNRHGGGVAVCRSSRC